MNSLEDAFDQILEKFDFRSLDSTETDIFKRLRNEFKEMGKESLDILKENEP